MAAPITRDQESADVPLRLIIVGPGRAGGALALAGAAAGHRIVGVLSRDQTQKYGPSLAWGEELPEADVLFLSVRDDAIAEVVSRLVGLVDRVGVVAHLSGFVPTTALRSLATSGVGVGGFHPLQTLPDADRGAGALAGAFVGIGGDPEAVQVLNALGQSLGMTPFPLEDAARPRYHAASAAASNFVVTALAVASDLYDSAGIDPRGALPLIRQVVSNVFEVGPDAALTGPIARGDHETVMGHLSAADEVSESVGRQFLLLARATALRAGRQEDFDSWT